MPCQDSAGRHIRRPFSATTAAPNLPGLPKSPDLKMSGHFFLPDFFAGQVSFRDRVRARMFFLRKEIAVSLGVPRGPGLGPGFLPSAR